MSKTFEVWIVSKPPTFLLEEEYGIIPAKLDCELSHRHYLAAAGSDGVAAWNPVRNLGSAAHRGEGYARRVAAAGNREKYPAAWVSAAPWWCGAKRWLSNTLWPSPRVASWGAPEFHPTL